MEVSKVLCHGVEMCWNTTEAFQHGSPVTEDLGIIPTREAFENGTPGGLSKNVDKEGIYFRNT